MAQEQLDQTGNEDFGRTISKIAAMFAELYANIVGAISATSLTVTGAVAGATATITGLVTGGSLKLDTGTKTATASAGAATLNKASGKITTEALTTAQDAAYTLTLTNSTIAAADVVLASIANGTNTQGTPILARVTPGSGSVVIVVYNKHASAEALNGTLVISYAVLKA